MSSPPPRANLSDQVRQEFRENGAVKLEGFLDEYWLNQCREKYQWSFDHPSPVGGFFFGSRNVWNQFQTAGTAVEEETRAAFLRLVRDGPFGQAAAQLFGSEKVWYYDHEMIAKRQTDMNKKGNRLASTKTLFHQDTPVFSFDGPDLIAFWICLDGFVPKASCLTIVKGSHRGPMYDNVLAGDKAKVVLPPIPDVERQYRAGEVELLSWDLQAGDVVAFHLGALHGGAHITEGFGSSVLPFYEDPPAKPVLSAQRRTLVLRFFGERVFYKELLGADGKAIGRNGESLDTHAYQLFGPDGKPVPTPMPWLEGLQEDEPFWHAGKGNRFVQVHGAPPAKL